MRGVEGRLFPCFEKSGGIACRKGVGKEDGRCVDAKREYVAISAEQQDAGYLWSYSALSCVKWPDF